jgi:hypothetical protein
MIIIHFYFMLLLYYYIVAAINRGNHQRVADLLVVVEARWMPREPPTSRDDSLVVVEG